MFRSSEKFNLQPGWAASPAAWALLFLLTVLATPTAQAQTTPFRVIHNFSAGLDGSTPDAGLAIDKAGNLYGTSYYGGGGPCNDGFGLGCGTVFQLTHQRSGWTSNPLYNFAGNNENCLELSFRNKTIFKRQYLTFNATRNQTRHAICGFCRRSL